MMMDSDGRAPSETGSRPADQARSGLAPSGFDPSRLPAFKPESYGGKPRWLPKPSKKLLRSLLAPLYERVAAMSRAERQNLITACLEVSQINCGWDEYAIAKLLYHAALHDETIAEVEELARDRDRSGEAGATGTGATEGNSPGRKAASPNIAHHSANSEA